MSALWSKTWIAAIALFTELGMEREGSAQIEGLWADLPSALLCPLPGGASPSGSADGRVAADPRAARTIR
jgi:hypothetical protein